MPTATETARSCVNDALAQAKTNNISEDALARALIAEAIAVFKKTRSFDDIASELVFFAENLSEEEDYNFMRP
ncbi:hypothetical protein [Sneathiella aquimaris]|uniref:hypothetical protein n=1 Tax=Sneathiella aquimaris TaxID=2599305 RepID=UPI00146B2593|nr:hypothetical protein [Sneathiella aquimaris]